MTLGGDFNHLEGRSEGLAHDRRSGRVRIRRSLVDRLPQIRIGPHTAGWIRQRLRSVDGCGFGAW